MAKAKNKKRGTMQKQTKKKLTKAKAVKKKSAKKATKKAAVSKKAKSKVKVSKKTSNKPKSKSAKKVAKKSKATKKKASAKATKSKTTKKKVPAKLTKSKVANKKVPTKSAKSKFTKSKGAVKNAETVKVSRKKETKKLSVKTENNNHENTATAKSEGTAGASVLASLPEAKVKLGQVVPAFEAPATGGEKITLPRGKKAVIFFYPKDATPGCTVEGHDFTRLHEEFKNRNVEVYGVSRDSMKSHEKFKEKEGYSIDLLSDPEEELCSIFGVIKYKNMYGKQVRGIERSTFVIDENGVLEREWRGVKVPGHAEEVLDFVKGKN